MYLGELIEGEAIGLVAGGGGVSIEGITDDSRTVERGGVFIARGGAAVDGRRYIGEAIRRGAVAIITDHRPTDEDLCVEGEHWSVAWACASEVDQRLTGRLAERFYGYPSRRLRLIGVTGTNGKTTTAFLVQHLLGQAGCRCGLVGTIFIDNGMERLPAGLTTPGAVVLSRHLAEMAANGCGAAVVEVSSHALHQGRVEALDFDTAIYTNLTGDHLDYHGDMDAYAAAKAKLFERLGPEACAVINAQDPYGGRMLRGCVAKRVRFGIVNEGEPCGADVPEYSGEIIRLTHDRSDVRLRGPWGQVEVSLPLVGRHNVANMLGAVAGVDQVVGGVVGSGPELEGSLRCCPAVPGRLERVAGGGVGPVVLVDYAHTHDALENVLSAVRGVASGRLTVVFGCGGDRDRTKRPKMADVACRWADRVVVTSDNPRGEDPNTILEEVLSGVPADARSRVEVELDRAKAIDLAIDGAGAGDTVLIAGKGHEDYQIIGTQRLHFDDREVACAALRRRKNHPIGCAQT